MTGLITYMRTDSVTLSKEAMAEMRGYITKNYGPDYLPKAPVVYRSTVEERAGGARGDPPHVHLAHAGVGRSRS